jgi:aminopeptidase-like protein
LVLVEREKVESEDAQLFGRTDAPRGIKDDCQAQEVVKVIEHLLKTVSPYLSGVNALDMIAHIHDCDRWSSFHMHHKAAEYCLSKLLEYGLEAELLTVPADGESVYGDWIVPIAWDARSATLTLLPSEGRGEVVLCDYKEDPCSLIVYSKPTPPEGVKADVVLVEGGRRAEDYEGVDVSGKIVFTSDSARYSRKEAMKRGALGLISDYLPIYEGCRPPMELPDVRLWERFSTEKGGWGMKKGDEPCWGFVLTPRQGQWLREIVKREKKVVLHAHVDARFYDGTIPVVTGFIPGRTDEEVLINGHLCEVGAIDDASGCGLAVEVLRCLNHLIEKGKLERPKCGIRMLFTYECMGTMAAVVEHSEIFERAVAGITLDSVGGRESICRAPLELSHNPHAQSSYTDTLLWLILRRQSEREKLLVNVRETSYIRADNIISDPMIGIPCPLLIEYPYTFYHSCADTPDKLDPEKLKWIGAVVATYVYFIANAGAKEALWLAREVLIDAGQAMMGEARRALDDGRDLRWLWRRLEYARLRYGMAMDSVLRLVSRTSRGKVQSELRTLKGMLDESVKAAFRQGAGVLGVAARKPRRRSDPHKKRASQVVPVRKVIGDFLGTRIPEEERDEWNKMCERNNVKGGVATRALYWADGKRSVAEIEELVECELELEGVRLLEFFQMLEGMGYVRLKKEGER